MSRLKSGERTDRLRQWIARSESDLRQAARESPELDAAVRRVDSGEPIDAQLADSLEAVILSYARPACRVGELSDPIAGMWSNLSRPPLRDRLVAAAAAVGQLEVAAGEVPVYAGTAFLVAADLIITARHVAESFATGIGRRDLGFKPGCVPGLDFSDGGDDDPPKTYPVAAVTMIHPYLDIALLRLGTAPAVEPLLFWAEDPGALEGRQVAAIAFPQLNQRYGLELQRRILATSAGVKRIMPGRVMPPRLYRVFDKQLLTLTHDGITLGGQSGAPILDLESGRVVGVSLASVYLDTNYAMPARELAQDPHLWEAGLRFDDAAMPTTSPWQEHWSEADQLPPALEGVEQAAATAAPSRSVRTAIERLVADHFADPISFRTFLVERGHAGVVRAVPERADSAELVRALDRRGLLDEGFLQALAAARAGDIGSAAVATAPLSPWLPQSMLGRVVWAVEPITAASMETYTVGSAWRDYVLGADGRPESAADAVQRLAYDPRPEIHQVLAWLLQRLYESLETSEQERVNALYEAMQHLSGGADARGESRIAPAPSNEPPGMQGIAYLARGVEAGRSVAMVKLSAAAGASASGCTGWLLTPQLVVVPAHVLSTHAPGPQDLRYGDARASERAVSAVVVFDFDDELQRATEHPVEALALSDLYLDVAILRLAAPVLDRSPLRIRPDAVPPNLTGLATIHHPHLGPKQLSRDGQLLRIDGNDVVYRIDTAPGSAGAPIFDDRWQVIAWHRAFTYYRTAPTERPLRAKLGTSAAALLGRLRDRSDIALWREVVAAQPTLKSVNVNIPTQQLGDAEKVPVVLQLLDREPLGQVPGFHVTSQTADIVTGFCDGGGLQALTDHPKVLSIDVSKPAGRLECSVTVPHIRATTIHQPPHAEEGAHALVALIDSGIDVYHRAFCDALGRTRVVAFWDQHDARSPAGDTGSLAAAESPEGEALVRQFGLGYGALYVASDIDRYLGGTPAPPTFPRPADMAHGTVVAGIAAGRRTGDGADYFAGGVAPAARLVIVRYDLQDASIGYSKGHIDALNFIGQVADMLQLPVVVNVSNGMNAGAHDGTSPVERLCNSFTDYGQKPGRIIVKSAGNERGLGRHATIAVPHGAKKFLRWRSQNLPGQPSSTAAEEIEIWFHHLNRYAFRLQPPAGSLSPSIDSEHRELNEFLSNDNAVSATLTPYRAENGGGFLNIKVSPGRKPEVQQGEWRLEISGLQVPQREPLHAWVELMQTRNVYFQDYLDDRCTITIPGTAEHVISVGAVEVADYLSPYEQSSWGPTRKGLEKPDLVAPGVGLFGPGAARGDRRSARPESGTSMAAPHVAGAVALALSACVKSGREPHSSFRIRGALQESARHGTQTWNEETGYGALDAEQFFIMLQN